MMLPFLQTSLPEVSDFTWYWPVQGCQCLCKPGSQSCVMILISKPHVSEKKYTLELLFPNFISSW
jgi:hypothetical protein